MISNNILQKFKKGWEFKISNYLYVHGDIDFYFLDIKIEIIEFHTQFYTFVKVLNTKYTYRIVLILANWYLALDNIEN